MKADSILTVTVATLAGIAIIVFSIVFAKEAKASTVHYGKSAEANFAFFNDLDNKPDKVVFRFREMTDLTKWKFADLFDTERHFKFQRKWRDGTWHTIMKGNSFDSFTRNIKHRGVYRFVFKDLKNDEFHGLGWVKQSFLTDCMFPNVNSLPGTNQTTNGPITPIYSAPVSSVPIPGAIWLLGSALLGMGFIKRKQ